jgi:hypothetical protein
MSYNLRKKPKKTAYKPQPARSAATKELAKALGLPWIDTSTRSCRSDDLECAHCKKVRPTKLCRVGVSVQVPSGIERLCEVCEKLGLEAIVRKGIADEPVNRWDAPIKVLAKVKAGDLVKSEKAKKVVKK